MQNIEKKEIGIYVHIPFCKQKCYYCDFVSFANKETYAKRYVDAVKKEIIKYASENKIMSNHYIEPQYIVKTIYIGGGTPSIIPSSKIIEILKTIKENFNVMDDAEITIEINPGTANLKKLKDYKKIGINRLSIGLQAVQDNILKTIGRIHNFKEFEQTYQIARDVGFKNINVDLMIGLPNQTLKNVKESINTLIKLNPEHISVYSLIVEENTKIEELIKNKAVKMESDEVERKMYWSAKKLLEENGYKQYEISNYAKPGYESKHNMDCWSQKEYIGIGVNASSYLDLKRYSNTENMEEYTENIENEKQSKNLNLEEIQNYDTQMKEYMMLGLRKIDGVNIQEFKNKFGKNPIMLYCKQLEKLFKQGLIKVENSCIKLTDKGIDLANLVWEEFI